MTRPKKSSATFLHENQDLVFKVHIFSDYWGEILGAKYVSFIRYHTKTLYNLLWDRAKHNFVVSMKTTGAKLDDAVRMQ